MMFFRSILSKVFMRVLVGTTAVAGQSMVQDDILQETSFIDLSDQLPSDIPKGERFKDVSKVDGLIGHHSATKAWSFKRVAEFHSFVRGWGTISYDWGVNWEGVIYKLKDQNLLGYHASGWNRDSFSIVLLGNFSEAIPTKEMKKGFHTIITYAFNKYQLSYFLLHTTAKRYQEDKYTECPGVRAFSFMSPYEFDSRDYPDRIEDLSPIPKNRFLSD